MAVMDLFYRPGLDRVTQLRAVALGFCVIDLCRAQPTPLISALQKLVLGGAAGSGDLGAASILHDLAASPDNSVFLELLCPTYAQGAAAFTDDIAVGGGVEGEGAPDVGDHATLTTDYVHQWAQHHVHTHAEAQCCLSPSDMVCGHVVRHHGRRATRIEEQARTSEPQRVTDAVRKHRHGATIHYTGIIELKIEIHAARVNTAQRAPYGVARHTRRDQGTVAVLQAIALAWVHPLGFLLVDIKEPIIDRLWQTHEDTMLRVVPKAHPAWKSRLIVEVKVPACVRDAPSTVGAGLEAYLQVLKALDVSSALDAQMASHCKLYALRHLCGSSCRKSRRLPLRLWLALVRSPGEGVVLGASCSRAHILTVEAPTHLLGDGVHIG
mmetsp:Transcript_15648/g.33292  ORF Transcript_15648/g.33292 Transcript_15648/m.33292 type:complete len:381 (-) Transcript_15648:346-1488(-)